MAMSLSDRLGGSGDLIGYNHVRKVQQVAQNCDRF